MEDYRLPASLVGMLKATRLTGIPRIQTDLQTARLAVTITWELASSTTKKKTTKPPASKKTAPAKKKKSLSPLTESSEPPKSSTQPQSPKPMPPPSPKPTPAPSPPKPSPKPMPPSQKKANRLHENVQRLTKVATRRLARQGGLTPEPKPATPQPSAPCPEVLSPQVRASADSCLNSQTTAESYAGRLQAIATHTTGTAQLPSQGLPAVSKQGQQTRQSVRSQWKPSRDRRSVHQTQGETPTLRQVVTIHWEKLCTEGA